MAVSTSLIEEDESDIIFLTDYQWIDVEMQYRLISNFESIKFHFVEESIVIDEFSRLPKFFPSILRRNLSFDERWLPVTPGDWRPKFLANKSFDVGYIYHTGPFVAKVLRGVSRKIILREDGLSNYIAQKLSFVKKIIRLVFGLPWRQQVWGDEGWVDRLEVEFPDELPPIVKGKAVELKINSLLCGLTDEVRKKFSAVFELERFPGDFVEKACLILTQPIEVIEGIDKPAKIEIYNKIAKNFYDSGYVVYIKNHPKEDFYRVENCKEYLPASFPIELWGLVVNYKFDVAVALRSTSMSRLTSGFSEKSFQLIAADKFNSQGFSEWGGLIDDELKSINARIK